MKTISLRGVSEHNLKNVSVDIPRDSLVVFTGVSGSGKSSLVFDTIYREGQRRFLESLSSYARQMLGALERPKADLIEGLSPTVAIEQRTVGTGPRSTVGTITEIYDHLRLLFARLGTAHCVRCGHVVEALAVDRIGDQVLSAASGARISVCAPVFRGSARRLRAALEEFRAAGFARFRVDGQPLPRGAEASAELPLRATDTAHGLDIVYDRLVAEERSRGRIAEAVEKCLGLADGHVTVVVHGVEGDSERRFSATETCPACRTPFPALEPRLFSFNSVHGACPRCRGLGLVPRVDTTTFDRTCATIGDVVEAIRQFCPMGSTAEGELRELASQAGALLAESGVRLGTRWGDVPAAVRRRLLHGEPLGFAGLLAPVEAQLLARERNVAARVATAAIEAACSHCDGVRLRPEARAVTFEGQRLGDFVAQPVDALAEVFAGVSLEGNRALIGAPILAEIRSRLAYLIEVGLPYLALGRSARSLSGGESQRVRLASQVGSRLQGLVFVLDEPSIGLHPRDNGRLLAAMRRLRDRGNTVLVVEHDRETIEAADQIVDLGPGAGREGGEIVAQGSRATLEAEPRSVTGAYLARRRGERPRARRTPGNGWLEIRGAALHNLKHIDVRVPLGVLVAVTGVSGSGKSSLVHGVLRPALSARRRHAGGGAPPWRAARGGEQIDRVVEVEQRSLARSARSNLATYTGIFDEIRGIFATCALARSRGYDAGRFSFNNRDGRCFICQGAGVRRVEMEILPTVELPCEECRGRRYNRETLEVTYRGKSIADVLAMPVEEAAEFFGDHAEIHSTLVLMCEIGLGYVELGQRASTFSGGEGQRIKLAAELRRERGRDLFVLDEPTTGLHFADIAKLLHVLERLVERGNTVLVIEHNLDLIQHADHVIDLGPEGGEGGGCVIATGTPEDIAACPASHTGEALRRELEARGGPAVPAPEPRPSRGAAPPPPPPPVRAHSVEVRGATQNNLEGIDVSIPHRRMTVVTGVSGSGKSSLAFDTIFAEGQRLYVDSLSTYARRFLRRLRSPAVERIDGLAPSIAIDQRVPASHPHSTVGTVSEIYHYLRLLYARVGHPFCPVCRERLVVSTPGGIVEGLLRRFRDRRAYILAPLGAVVSAGFGRVEANASPIAPVEPGAALCDALLNDGFTRVLVGEREIRLDDASGEALAALAGPLEDAWVVVDRVVVTDSARSRIATSTARALATAGGRAGVRLVDGPQEEYSTSPRCVHGHYALEEPVSPRLFSFNTQAGACALCQGKGSVEQIRRELVVVDPERPLFGGALLPTLEQLVFPPGSPARAQVEGWARAHGVSLEAPLRALDAARHDRLLHGQQPGPGVDPARFAGVHGLVRNWYLEHALRLKPSLLRAVLREEVCPQCGGTRLRAAANQVEVCGQTIGRTVALSLEEAARFFDGLELSPTEADIARLVVAEIAGRLRFLCRVGLGYLTLERPAATLSGGEAQRIRLAKQIANRMTGVLYVLDEPTVGLHARDTGRLLATLSELRELGNTVLLVEHDREVIAMADYLLDLGPGAGARGGRVVACGSLEEIRAAPHSLTGRYLRGELHAGRRRTREPAAAGLTLRGVRHNNLAGLDVTVPLGRLTAVTGVSGCGKSSLVVDVLSEALRAVIAGRRRRRRPATAFAFERLDELVGAEAIERVVVVDQSPLGNSPRSNPATYTRAWEEIRRFYAMLPAARTRGYGRDRFSFNSPEGRCAECRGEGAVKVAMHFLSDIWLPCESCGGFRFNRETLAVRYRGLHVGEVLQMEVADAAELFGEHPRIAGIMRVLEEVGLGYLKLGQSATTLSGGEAQRVKLAAELANRSQSGTLYVLDEPTTGLHFEDVRRLLDLIERLVDEGATVVVIEHNLDVIASSDHVIDMGPEGGAAGGRIVACGTPAEVAACTASHTAPYLARTLAALPAGPPA